jgi:hypothetical protein
MTKTGECFYRDEEGFLCSVAQGQLGGEALPRHSGMDMGVRAGPQCMGGAVEGGKGCHGWSWLVGRIAPGGQVQYSMDARGGDRE